jgi:hypothetical protein
MSETEMFPTRKAYGMFAFWGIHTLMLFFFMMAEATGLHFPVGSSLFYFTWIAIWITHGLSLGLMQQWDQENADGDPAAGKRFWRRLVLGAHSALYVAYGPIVILWWLMSRGRGPLQPGEGQGMWIYPVWLIVLLAHGVYVMIRERQEVHKRKRTVPNLKRLMETGSDEVWDEETEGDYRKNKR